MLLLTRHFLESSHSLMVTLVLLSPNWKESTPIMDMWKAHIGRPDSVIFLIMVQVCPKS